ncbi:MAG: thiamine diphosphokinase [Anaerolineales bacterium]|nr:thiamine diphosphokinase [Anaerolineae bacterium]PWB53264.1 MAG: thiamine diphosphokinase [Anaerolineales bacterium]
MHRVFIFANGKMEQAPPIINELRPSDLVIAADGGTHHCRALGILPQVIIGDLDSLKPDDVSYYHSAGTEIKQFPAHKDETDLELALWLAIERGISQVNIIGGMGARWDMTIANVMLAAHPKFSGLSISLLDGNQALHVIHGESRSTFADRVGSTLSLIPLAGDAQGITTHGLEYPLVDETLKIGSPRGVSNVIIENPAWIYLRQGTLCCCLSMGEND